MIDATQSLTSQSTDPREQASGPEEGIDKITALLGDLGNPTSPASPVAPSQRPQPHAPAQARSQAIRPSKEHELLAVRLGVAASLFSAMRYKHPQTAEHCLRVAFGCSAWAERLQLPENVRDKLEVAALFHDIGKIATPDAILSKADRLNVDEQRIMQQTPDVACDILRSCCGDSDDLLTIIRLSRQWYNTLDTPGSLQGDKLPLGARMLAIVEAFDSMTTKQVYRPSLNQEQAISELIACAGTQFDPELVNDFVKLLKGGQAAIYGAAAGRWLSELHDGTSNQLWHASHPGGNAPIEPQIDSEQVLLHKHLLDTMCDGVVAIDQSGAITHWNDALEKMTETRADSMIGTDWKASNIRWIDSRAENAQENCRLLDCLSSGTQSRQRLRMSLPSGKEIPVKVNFIPVLGDNTEVRGALAIINDISQEESLAQEVRTLHAKATRDGLTGIANRAEFDRFLTDIISTAAQSEVPASLILCDIDHFKSVNDNFGHQAGDEVLVTFASLLAKHSRDEDLVARYGGEEFAILCPGCDNETAAARAEVIREELFKTSQPTLNNKHVSASFGVTQYQPGDTESTIIARSDRALYKAKENGRNRVEQMGLGANTNHAEGPKDKDARNWFHWLLQPSNSDHINAKMVTRVPVEMVIEKLRGFIADQNAEVLRIQGQRIELKLDVVSEDRGRRRADAISAFQVTIQLYECEAKSALHSRGNRPIETIIDTAVIPWKNRDRRNRNAKQSCEQVVASLRSYLMADFLQE